MLILGRKRGQQLVIGDDVVVTVVKIGHGQVRLGIEAPRSVRVDRSEVRARVEAEAATEPPPS